MKLGLDCLVIGAHKAGTTALFEYMRRHPQLYLPPGKERPFFSDQRAFDRGLDSYLRDAFANAPPNSLWGTATPAYLMGELADCGVHDARGNEYIIPARVRKSLPDVRLIAILRDPVERCISHYRMSLLFGWEEDPLDDAINKLLDPTSAASPGPEMPGYVRFGEYGRLLRPYFELFSGSQLLVAFSDDLGRAPADLMRDIFAFLGVDPYFVPANLTRRFREGSTERRYSWANPSSLRRGVAANRVARSLWRTLSRSARRRIDLAYIEARYRLELWNRVPGAAAGPSAETRRALIEHYRPDTEVLTKLIGRRPPWADGSSLR